MNTENMDLEKTAKMLDLFCAYWPSFSTSVEMAEAWAAALKDYHKAEAWEALTEFRAEEMRVFAPAISELIGRMDYLRDRRAAEKANEMLMLEAPKKRNFDPMESYTYKTSRTSPKRKSDEPDWEVKSALRITKDRRKELYDEMQKRGYVKKIYSLPNGRSGSIWVRT
jgi:hypothetical protein